MCQRSETSTVNSEQDRREVQSSFQAGNRGEPRRCQTEGSGCANAAEGISGVLTDEGRSRGEMAAGAQSHSRVLGGPREMMGACERV